MSTARMICPAALFALAVVACGSPTTPDAVLPARYGLVCVDERLLPVVYAVSGADTTRLVYGDVTLAGGDSATETLVLRRAGAADATVRGAYVYRVVGDSIALSPRCGPAALCVSGYVGTVASDTLTLVRNVLPRVGPTMRYLRLRPID